MLRLLAATPPLCPANPKRWVVIDLEYFHLSGQSNRTEGDTLAYLWEKWPQREPAWGSRKTTSGPLSGLSVSVARGEKKSSGLEISRGPT